MYLLFSGLNGIYDDKFLQKAPDKNKDKVPKILEAFLRKFVIKYRREEKNMIFLISIKIREGVKKTHGICDHDHNSPDPPPHER